MGNLMLALLFLALPSCLEAYVTNVCASEYCCSDTSRCMLGQGDCDEHVECGLGLHCGVDNCPQDTEGDMDCCKPKDCKLGPVGSTRPDWECCSPSSPCLQAGEGDCDSDSDCGAGLRCGYNNCGPNDPTGVMDCCTPQPDCKQGSSWLDWRCCTSSLPCGWGQGDCNEDSDCAGELVCGRDNCGRMGRPESHWRMDCCTNTTTQSYRRETTMIQSYTEATTTTQLNNEPTTPLAYKSTTTDFEYYYDDPDYEYVTETTTKYGTEEPTTEYATQEPTTEYATQEPTTEYTTEEPTTEYSTEEPTKEYTTEELTTEYTTEEPTTEYSTEEPTTEYTTEEPTTEYTTEEPTTEYTTKEPTTEYTTEEPTTEYATEEPTTTTTAEYTTEGVTTPEYVTKATTIEYVTEETTPEYATKISTQEYTTEETTTKNAKEETTPEYANKAKTGTSAAWLCPPQKPVLFSSCDLVDSKARCNYGQRLCCGGRPMGHLWQMLCHEDMGIWVGYTSGPCPTDCSLPEGRSWQQGEAPTSPTPPVSCQSGSFPMCGDDKRNYANECQVLAAGAEPACYGRCPCTV